MSLYTKKIKQKKNAFTSLSEGMVSTSNCSIRLTGLSGLGKSRLLIEYKSRNNLNDDDFFVFNGAGNTREIEDSIKIAEDQVKGFIIIDNCPIELHNFSTRAIHANQSPLKLITTYFYHEEDKRLIDSIHIRLEQLDQIKLQTLSKKNLPELDPRSKKKLEKFIDGFPLLAHMSIKQFKVAGRLTIDFNESDLIENLINGDGELSSNARELIKVFALFDYFKFQRV